METVGIIMATYNGAEYIREQMESILNGSHPSVKIWVCDDGSTDNTPLIVKEYADAYPGKVMFTENATNIGVALNFLHALKKSDTKYTMFCDQDDVWKKDKIEKTLNEMIRVEKKYTDKIPVMVFTDAVVTDAKLQTISESFCRGAGLNTNHLGFHDILMENKVQGCTAMMNEAVRQKLTRMPQNARMHDWWIALLSAAFGKISFLEEQTLLYRQHGKNVVGNRDFIASVVEKVGSLKKQREVLIRTQKQAAEFYQIYQEELSKENRRLVYEFSMLSKRNWFSRRYKILKYGFLKTGLIRNIGVLLII